MEDKKLEKEVKEPVVEEVEEVEVKEVEEVEEVKEVKSQENTTAEEIITDEVLSKVKVALLNVSLDGDDILLMLTALKEYNNFLIENKRRTNQIVIDEEFNKTIDAKIKRTDELRFLIKKKVLIVDKSVELYSIEEDGEVIGIETFETTEEGKITKVSKPNTVGQTPDKLLKEKQAKVKTSVQSVSEEM
jgi:hypothetical protein